MCPVCREEMVAFELEGVEIDHCTTCLGTWLDSGELEMLCELTGGAPGGLEARLAAGVHGPRSKRRCPRCPRKLRRFSLQGKQPVHLDRCPREHGFWFDQGEMRAVIQAAAGENDGTVARFFGDLLHSELSGPSMEGG